MAVTVGLFCGEISLDDDCHVFSICFKPAHRVCITPIYEGLPLVALEAMAKGIPVCSFAVGELPSLIEEGKNGWIIPNGNLELMAQKIRQWWQMPEQDKHQMRAAAIATIHNHYSDHAVVPLILDHYKSLGCTNTAKMAERTKTTNTP